MEINLLLRTNDLKELEDFVHMMQAFPKIRQALTIEQDITNMIRHAESLRAEITALEHQRMMVLSIPLHARASLSSSFSTRVGKA